MFSFFKNRTARKRIFFFFMADTFLIILAIYLAFLLRFGGEIPSKYFSNGMVQQMVALSLVFSLPIFYFFGLYSFSWSYVSTKELISLFKATTLSFIFLGFSIFFLRSFNGFPRSTIFISYFLVFIFSGSIRLAKRVYLELTRGNLKQKKGLKENRKRTLIVGAGDAAEQILRSIISDIESTYLPVAVVDDNPVKQGVSIHGIKVLGKIDDISGIIKEKEIEQMIVALPSAGPKIIKKAVELGREAGLKDIKVAPSVAEIINNQVSMRDLREIEVEDLLGRQSVEPDVEAIEGFIRGRNVLITGAAGSIGSELSRQVAKFNPKLLLPLDQDETGIFNISEELRSKFPSLKVKSLVADICDKEKIEKIFINFKPEIIFHVAAYKHVPLMEENPDEAIKNNILGMKIVAEAALKTGVEKFIFISTDKAVNPTSVMGKTKRIGEMLGQFFNRQNSTKFISVRFGNVLNSRGSVIPIFKEQIRKGGPVEVTHPEMKRYFMTIAEACLLVLQAAEMGKGGEVFVLDMGEPVKILDLAKEMIKLSGFEVDKDIPIVFIGPRPGENLFEEILSAEEGTVVTRHQKIFQAKLSSFDEDKFKENLSELEKSVRGLDDGRKLRIILENIINSKIDKF